VVADGENVNGGQGASFHYIGEFYRDELGTTQAINFDGGHSTEVILRGRRINTMTGEDSRWDKGPYSESASVGGVHNCLMVGP
jgi:exopolysaccharide biosynthesis protein